MREGASASVLASASSWGCRVVSTRAGVLLANDIPVLSGRARWTTNWQVPDSVTINVPRSSVVDSRTVDWLPVTPDAPLARYGQLLDVTMVADGVDTRLGRFLNTDWDYDESTVRVTAPGLLRFAADDRLPASLSPRDDGTLQSEFLRLLPEQVSAQFDPALVNRDCPRSMEWDEDRLASLYEIADAWPARVRMDSWGQVLVLPPLEDVPEPVLTFTDGEGGTVVSVPRAESRDRSWNHVVARSTADGVDAWAEAVRADGPTGVATYGRVTKFFTSPLLENEAQCFAAAQTQLQDAQRTARTLTVRAAPDPRVELDDPVEIIRDGFRDWGYVVGVDLPLTVNDGAMVLEVGVV